MAGDRWLWISALEKSDGPESVTLSRVLDVHSKHDKLLRIAHSCCDLWGVTFRLPGSPGSLSQNQGRGAEARSGAASACLAPPSGMVTADGPTERTMGAGMTLGAAGLLGHLPGGWRHLHGDARHKVPVRRPRHCGWCVIVFHGSIYTDYACPKL